MFEKIRFRRLKKEYDNVIDIILDNDLDYLKESLEKTLLMAKKLLSSMNKTKEKMPDEFHEVEKMVSNLTTIYHYFLGYYSYSNFLEYDELMRDKDYELAIKACQNARFSKNDSFKYTPKQINEQRLVVVKNGKAYWCQGLQTLISDHAKAMNVDILSICIKREISVGKIVEEIQEREEQERIAQEREEYERWQRQKEQEHSYDLEKAKREYNRCLENAQSYSYVNPRHSLDMCKSAYNWVKDFEELEYEKEYARKQVVKAYIDYAKSTIRGTSGFSNEGKLSYYENALDICSEARENWTTSYDDEDVMDLENELRSEYNYIYNQYEMEDD